LKATQTVSAQAGDAFDWFVLAMEHRQLGRADEASGWYAKAVQWAGKNQPNNKGLGRLRAKTANLLDVTESSPPANASRQS
jgi:cytochrome c-type biogenesis protein CcmH/NrfG